MGGFLGFENIPGEQFFPVFEGRSERRPLEKSGQVLGWIKLIMLRCLNEGIHATGTLGSFRALIE